MARAPSSEGYLSEAVAFASSPVPTRPTVSPAGEGTCEVRGSLNARELVSRGTHQLACAASKA